MHRQVFQIHGYGTEQLFADSMVSAQCANALTGMPYLGPSRHRPAPPKAVVQENQHSHDHQRGLLMQLAHLTEGLPTLLQAEDSSSPRAGPCGGCGLAASLLLPAC